MEKQFYNFVKEVYDKQLGVEGIAIADGEKILMEHHFTPDQARNIYSHTKSYMSTAVGLAIADGKLSLDDRLAEFFPEAVPENAQPELFEIRLRHLLMMSSGFHEPYLMGANPACRCRCAGLRQIYVKQTRKGTAGQRIRLFNGRQHSGRPYGGKGSGKTAFRVSV